MIKKILFCFAILLLFFPIFVLAENICQYANSASATEEANDRLASFAVGAPDCADNCVNWESDCGWGKTNWGNTASIELTYDVPVYATNVSVLYDEYETLHKIDLWDIDSSEWVNVHNGFSNNCPYVKTFNGIDFLTNKVRITSIGSDWCMIDAVKLCGETTFIPVCGNGIIESGEECDDGNLVNGDACSSDCKIEEISGDICQYANSASATSELPGYESMYSVGEPDSDGDCSTKPSLYTSWEKTDLNIDATLTLTFPYSIRPDNLKIFGDYDLCINKIWLWKDNAWYLVHENAIDKGINVDCNIDFNFSLLDFKTNKVKIRTCDWTWSVIDSVKFCGTSYSYPKVTIVNPTQDRIIDGSENSTLIEINTDIISGCEFSYDKNFIFNQGTRLSTTNGITHSYNLIKPISMDSIGIYYKCQSEDGEVNPYSLMHRFSFKEVDNSFIEVCNWYDCLSGAVSISNDPLDTKKPMCREELEERGLKGTYFLGLTDTYNQSDWDLWTEVYNSGHEIGGHTQSHNCSALDEEDYFRDEVQFNIDDIMGNINIPRDEITTLAWPCGISPPYYQEWLSDYYLFARGYHLNSIESKNPENLLDIKSINTVGIGLINPPDYYLLADVTENYQDWINYVYHYSCYNEEIFDYLLTKDMWIETISTVSKYIKERESVSMKNIQNTTTGVKFDLVNDLNTTIFDKELTLKIYLGNENVDNITINGEPTEFTQFMIKDQAYVKFNVLPTGNDEIEISGLRVEVPYCGDSKLDQDSEECDDGNNANEDGCSSNCKSEDVNKIYITLYVGNIDGGSDIKWYPFLDRLTAYYEDNQIPIGFSFFPASINGDNNFSEIFKRMYLADNIELFQKGFNMNDTEKRMDELLLEEQRAIIKRGQYYYIEKMNKILNSSDVNIPVTYVAPFSRFTPDTRKALEQLGFNNNFGLYHQLELGPVGSTATLDSVQYGVSFTVSGAAGRNEVFKQPDDIIQEVFDYYRKNVQILTINGKRVIPLFVHEPDFEDAVINNKIDEAKWQIYNKTITKLANNPDVIFLTPSQVWNMRHPYCIPTSVDESFCNRIDDDCDGEIDEDFVSVSTNCGVGACESTGVLICNSYEVDSCTPGIPALNDITCNGIDDDCDGQVDEDCIQPGPACQYASSATATEEASDRLASFAVGAPNCADNCVNWEADCGWGKTNWFNNAFIELTYNVPVYATNVSVLYDAHPSLNNIYLLDIGSGKWVKIHNGLSTDCPHVETFTQTNFLTNKIRIDSMSNDWSMIDAVELCGEVILGPVCGNGIIESGEECDDGNLVNNDGCSNICKIEEISGDICQYANSASATEEANDRLALLATGAPNCNDMCTNWESDCAWGKTN